MVNDEENQAKLTYNVIF